MRSFAKSLNKVSTKRCGFNSERCCQMLSDATKRDQIYWRGKKLAGLAKADKADQVRLRTSYDVRQVDQETRNSFIYRHRNGWGNPPGSIRNVHPRWWKRLQREWRYIRHNTNAISLRWTWDYNHLLSGLAPGNHWWSNCEGERYKIWPRKLFVEANLISGQLLLFRFMHYDIF